MTPTERKALMAMMKLLLSHASQSDKRDCGFCGESHYDSCRKNCIYKVAEGAYYELKKEVEGEDDDAD